MDKTGGIDSELPICKWKGCKDDAVRNTAYCEPHRKLKHEALTEAIERARPKKDSPSKKVGRPRKPYGSRKVKNTVEARSDHKIESHIDKLRVSLDRLIEDLRNRIEKFQAARDALGE